MGQFENNIAVDWSVDGDVLKISVILMQPYHPRGGKKTAYRSRLVGEKHIPISDILDVVEQEIQRQRGE